MSTVLNHIFFNKDLDLDFVYHREDVPRPSGKIEMVLYFRKPGLTFRMYLINDYFKSFHLIGQLRNNRFIGKNGQLHNAVVLANQKNRNSPEYLDMNSPWFPIEWSYPISLSDYNAIFEGLKQIQIPISRQYSGLDGYERILHYCPDNTIHLQWWCEYKPFSELTTWFDKTITNCLNNGPELAFLRRI